MVHANLDDANISVSDYIRRTQILSRSGGGFIKWQKRGRLKVAERTGSNGSRKRTRPLSMMFRPIFTNVAVLLLYATHLLDISSIRKCKTVEA